ncbi:CD59 glycoprotein isoform 1-T3 [Thomomys bottae]
MRNIGGFRLLGFLLILAALSYSGYSLICYHCINPVTECKSNSTCASNLDACLVAQSGSRIYHQCWAMRDCNFEFISNRLGEPDLQYRCCQKDFCNYRLSGASAALSGKMVLLAISFLAAVWDLYL